MKMKAIAAGLVGLASTLAYAQNSVTLYGAIDDGFNYTSNVGGKQSYQMQSGYAQGSRWGLKGKEDLGGGLNAIFTLESGFDLNTGRANQGGRLFGRQAYVGVRSDSFGTLTMGRQYDSVVDYLAPLTANGWYSGYLFAHPYDNDNTDNSFRVSNSVKYASPNIAGVTFGGVYGFSNSAGAFANNRLYSVGAAYNYGPLSLAAAYLDINNVGANSAGAVATNDTSFFAGHHRTYGAGISYTVENALFGFVYSHTSLDNPTGNGYLTPGTFPTGITVGALRFDNFEVNAKYSFAPTFFAQAMYTYTLGKYEGSNGSARPKWHQAGLMFDYFISKRTDIYLQGVYQKVAGGNTGTFLDQAFITGTDNSSSSNHQFVTRIAMRHLF
ncbi:porin [Burkholderia sp. Ac-20353]|uniref:porin n=1 Tax=Burkholderia sp. Ac-20353 TaxID=2703894 RepID=UPI00197C1705|nr:porin [Burkholderia sp. Ac-20353]MBN3786537.1 porin [Burkholderia sp. Ac-20353]